MNNTEISKSKVAKYELWPALTPKTEDVSKFKNSIAAEMRKRRPNNKLIQAMERDMVIAQQVES